ncbi:MAG TPA: glucose 1-dehydrogenase [Myxococcota bacterium]|nr:glucose 1-dehydrogenase [Myxococcota bacterium]
MTTRLDGKVALVTGGSRGIGEAIAARLAAAGARTVVVSRKPEGIAEAAARVRAATGGEVHGYAMHVGDPAHVAAALDQIVADVGPVDVLVNNAATNPYFGPMMGATIPAFTKTFDVNVIGPWELTRLVTQRMLDDGRPGAVVFVSSILGLQSAPLQGIYGMTKAAVISLTKTLAVELGPAGVRVNAIAPGLVDTRLASAITSTPELRRMFEERTPLGRIAEPDDIAGSVAWLVSDDARYVTGQVLAVDGGYSIR